MRYLSFVLIGAIASSSMAACVPTMSAPREYAARPLSREAGENYFLRTGGGDPYRAGMAYPVFLALMELYPHELGHDWNEFNEKFGMIADPAAKGDPKAIPIGFHLTTDPNTEVPWLVANCQMCHAEKIRLETGDLVVSGLGKKAVRPHAYGNALMRIGADRQLSSDRIAPVALRLARERKIPWSENLSGYILDATVDGFKALAIKRGGVIKRFDNALPGRMATIESFAVALNDYRMRPILIPEPTGWTKVPDVRGFPFRETASYDASGFGSPQALVLEADFLFGARPEWYVSHPHIATSMYLYLKSFRRHLPYPKPIDSGLAANGKRVFEIQNNYSFFGSHLLELSDLNLINGIYFVKIITSYGMEVEKIIVANE